MNTCEGGYQSWGGVLFQDTRYMAEMKSTIQIEDLYERYAHILHRRCRLLLGNEADAEDAVQEIFIKALRSLDGFRHESSLLTWLYRIATNHCLNVLRSRRRHQTYQNQKEQTEAQNTPRTDSETIEDATFIRSLILDLDRRSQELVVLYFIDGMNQEEAALEMGLSVPTVRKYLNRFLQKARKRM